MRSAVSWVLVSFAACGGDDTSSLPGADASLPDGSPADVRADVLPRPSLPPFDWVGVIGTGQSLSVGATAKVMTTTQPFHNMKLVDTGPNPKYPIAADSGAPAWATAPLVEPIRAASAGNGPGYTDGQYPNDIFGETPHSGMANTLTPLWNANGGVGEYVTAHTVVGWSGHCLSQIDKAGGMRAYPASLQETRVWKSLAGAEKKSFGVGGIVLTHGECDAGNGNYGAGLWQLLQDYDTDLKAITQQTSKVALLVSQQSTIASGPTGSAVQVWKAGVDHVGRIVCTGPKYAYQYSPDRLHFPAPGYERLGQKYAEVFDAVVNREVAWAPLQPKKVARVGAVVTIDFNVPNPPLVWDSHVTPPHQSVNTEWAAGKGFEVWLGNTRLTIGQVVISADTVTLTLAKDPGVGKVTVGYATVQDGQGHQGGTDLGLRGLLRDSDEFAGWDEETVEASLTNGSAVAMSTTPGAFVHRTGRDLVTGQNIASDTIVQSHDTDDQLTLSAAWSGPTSKVALEMHHDERNWCVHFSMDEQ